MAVRHAIKKSGGNVNTLLEIMFRSGGRNFSTGFGSQSGKIYFDFATADYIADTSIPDANFRIDVPHNLQTQIYNWNVYKTEDSRPIIIVDWWQGDNTLSLWFVGNSKSIRVIIDP